MKNKNGVIVLEGRMQAFFSRVPPEYVHNGIEDSEDRHILAEIFLDIDAVAEDLDEGVSEIDQSGVQWSDICYAWTFRRQCLSSVQWLQVIDILERLISKYPDHESFHGTGVDNRYRYEPGSAINET